MFISVVLAILGNSTMLTLLFFNYNLTMTELLIFGFVKKAFTYVHAIKCTLSSIHHGHRYSIQKCNYHFIIGV